MISRFLTLVISLLLVGCDIAAMMADPKVAQREADAKAIGSACRYGMRSIEDCYMLNEKASKSAIFAGWKEMDQYMRDNKVDGVPAKVSKSGGTITDEVAPPGKAVAVAQENAKDKPAADTKAKAK
jgi:hypothetical protein